MRCCGANGRILLVEVLENNCNQVFNEILRVVLPWDENRGTSSIPTGNQHPLRIGVYCAKGRHRAFAKTLLAAAGLRALGYQVFTESPCTDPCGRGSPEGYCWKLGHRLTKPARDELFYQLSLDARLAREIAIRTSSYYIGYYSAIWLVVRG